MKKIKVTVQMEGVVPDHMADKIANNWGGPQDRIALVEFLFTAAGKTAKIEGEIIPDEHVERLI